MYSAWQRVSVLSSFFSTVLGVTLLVIAATNFVMPRPTPAVNLTVNRVALYPTERWRSLDGAVGDVARRTTT